MFSIGGRSMFSTRKVRSNKGVKKNANTMIGGRSIFSIPKNKTAKLSARSGKPAVNNGRVPKNLLYRYYKGGKSMYFDHTGRKHNLTTNSLYKSKIVINGKPYYHTGNGSSVSKNVKNAMKNRIKNAGVQKNNSFNLYGLQLTNNRTKSAAQAAENQENQEAIAIYTKMILNKRAAMRRA
jgi:hypothetical protein